MGSAFKMAEEIVAEEGQQMGMKWNVIDNSGEVSKDHTFLRKMLNKTFRIRITDGRTLIGSFLCTDKDQNIILGQCQEYVKSSGPESGEEARILGLAMIPGKHIVSIELDTRISEFGKGAHPLNCFTLENVTET